MQELSVYMSPTRRVLRVTRASKGRLPWRTNRIIDPLAVSTTQVAWDTETVLRTEDGPAARRARNGERMENPIPVLVDYGTGHLNIEQSDQPCARSNV